MPGTGRCGRGCPKPLREKPLLRAQDTKETQALPLGLLRSREERKNRRRRGGQEEGGGEEARQKMHLGTRGIGAGAELGGG